MYKTIYIPVDNSDHSNTAVDVGVELAKTYGSKIVGSHVYAAKMHDKRFKQMEAGLPEEYHDEGTRPAAPDPRLADHARTPDHHRLLPRLRR